jgi:hypothetical protein
MTGMIGLDWLNCWPGSLRAAADQNQFILKMLENWRM